MQIELKLLQSQLGITFIFVTHDQEEALSMSDRIAVMLDGRIEQLGDPYTIYEHPASAFVAGFIGQQNFFHGSGSRRRQDGQRRRVDLPQLTRSTTGLTTGCSALGCGAPGGRHRHRSRPRWLRSNVLRGTLAGVSHLGDVIQFVVCYGRASANFWRGCLAPALRGCSRGRRSGAVGTTTTRMSSTQIRRIWCSPIRRTRRQKCWPAIEPGSRNGRGHT